MTLLSTKVFSGLVLVMAASALGLVSGARADPVDIPGVADFDYFKDGVKTAQAILEWLNPNPVEGLKPKVSMSFAETPSQAFLTIAGGNFGTPDTTETFKINGSYWGLNFSITQDAAAVVGFDSVAMSGSFFHLKGPHADDGLGTPHNFNLVLEFGSPGCCGSGETAHGTNRHTNSFQTGLGGTYTNIVDPILGLILSSDITTWNFTGTALHAVPEPATALLFALAMAALPVLAARRRRGAT